MNFVKQVIPTHEFDRRESLLKDQYRRRSNELHEVHKLYARFKARYKIGTVERRQGFRTYITDLKHAIESLRSARKALNHFYNLFEKPKVLSVKALRELARQKQDWMASHDVYRGKQFQDVKVESCEFTPKGVTLAVASCDNPSAKTRISVGLGPDYDYNALNKEDRVKDLKLVGKGRYYIGTNSTLGENPKYPAKSEAEAIAEAKQRIADGKDDQVVIVKIVAIVRKKAQPVVVERVR